MYAPSETNEMLQNGNNPNMGTGIVDFKAFIDEFQVAKRQEDAQDPKTAVGCYPGAAREENLGIMPGEFCYAPKDARNSVAEGDVNELVMSSVAGLRYEDYGSHRSMQANFYPVGVASTESRVGPVNEGTTEDPKHGVGGVRVGTVPTINTGDYVIYAGNPVMLRFPTTRLTPGAAHDYAIDKINQRARGGQPNTKLLLETVPFDYTDFSINVACSLATIRDNKAQGGICDMEFHEFFGFDGIPEAASFTSEQEEAAGLKYGSMSNVGAALEVLVESGYITINLAAEAPAKVDAENARTQVSDLLKNIGLWETGDCISNDTKNDSTVIKILSNMNCMHGIDKECEVRRQGLGKLGSSKKIADIMNQQLHTRSSHHDKYAKLRAHSSRFTHAAVISGLYTKSEWVVGTALGGANPSGTLPMMLGHTHF